MGDLDPVEEVAPTVDGICRRRAIVVGIDRYTDPALRLRVCVASARRVGGVLADAGYQVTALYAGAGADRRPTLAGLLGAIDDVLGAADADDLAVVYVACRGRVFGGRPHLLLADTPPGGRGLAVARLLTELRREPRQVAIFLDASDLGARLDPACAQAAGRSVEREGAFAYLSGGGASAATAGDGAFSAALADGLAGAAADPSGVVRFSALARHVQDVVARAGGSSTTPAAPVLRLEVADLPLVAAHAHTDLPSSGAVTAAAFSPDGGRLVVGDEASAVQVWDLATGAITRRWLLDSPVRAVQFSPDGASVDTASERGALERWDLGRTPPPPTARIDVGGRLDAAAWSTSDRRAVAAVTELRAPGLTDVAPRTKIDRLAAARLAARLTSTHAVWLGGVRGGGRRVANPHPILALARTPAPGWSITGDAQGELRLWRHATRASSVIGRHEGPVRALAVSPDGRWLAAGGVDDPDSPGTIHQARLWRLATGKPTTLRGHRGGVLAICFAPDGRRVAAAGGDGVVRLCDAITGDLRRELTVAVDGAAHRAEVTAVAFAPDGRRLFAGYADGRRRLFDV